MANSKIAIFYEKGRPLELQSIEIPALKEGEILVQVEYTTLCRSDLHTFCGNRIEKTPTILGHEIVGRIVEFGHGSTRLDDRGKTLSEGDRISWAIYASDPEHPLSQKGMPQKADGLFKYGHERISDNSTLHGGLGEHIILRPNTPLAIISDAVPLPIAATINCAVATVAGALRQAGPLEGKTVLVSGAGMLGLVACAMAKTRGAAFVATLDVDLARLETSKRYGADTGFEAGISAQKQIQTYFQKEKPFDIVLEFSGVAAAVEETIGWLGYGGTAVWIGATYSQPNIQVNAEKIVRGLITIKGLHNYNRKDFLEAVEFIERYHSHFPFAEMIKGGFHLSQVNEAFLFAVEHNPFRVGLEIGPVTLKKNDA